MSDAPERIWAEIERSWSGEPVLVGCDDADPRGRNGYVKDAQFYVEYIRADIHDALRAEAGRLREEVERLTEALHYLKDR